MIVFVIRINDHHPDAGLFWTGYKNKCHGWSPAVKDAIQFVRLEDAQRAGVSAPDTPYKKHTEFFNNGVEALPHNPNLA